MTETLEIEGVGTIAPEDYSILIVDDEPEYIEVAKEFLSHSNSKRIAVASTLDEGTRLLRARAGRWDAILTDVTLDDGPSLSPDGAEQGDVWLLRHAKEAGSALKAVVTGYPERVKNQQALEDIGARVVIKATTEFNDLLAEVEAEAQRKRAHIRRAVDELRSGAAALALGGEARPGPEDFQLAGLASQLFREWLGSRKDQDQQGIMLGDQRLSVRQLQDEVARQTDIGRRLLEMFLKHMRYRMGLAKLPSFDEKMAKGGRS